MQAYRLTSARPSPGQLITEERLAATRNRPFHPTARAAIGWTARELDRYGPMRQQPLGLDWVAVRRDRLRHGSATASDRLHELLLTGTGQQHLADAARHAGLLPRRRPAAAGTSVAYGWDISHRDFLSHPYPDQVFLGPHGNLTATYRWASSLPRPVERSTGIGEEGTCRQARSPR